MKITLYRGISVRPENVCSVEEFIRSKGLIDVVWKRRIVDVVDIRSRLNDLIIKTNLKMEDVSELVWNKDYTPPLLTRSKATPAVHACGDEIGATYYATVHNNSKIDGETSPLIIKFQVDIESVFIDPVDFMYPAVLKSQTSWSDSKKEHYNSILVNVFGGGIQKYILLIQSAFSTIERANNLRAEIIGQEPMAIAYIATQDLELVGDHYLNNKVIEGRVGVRFCSAFLVKTPILPNQIISVYRPNVKVPVPDISIKQLWRY